MSRLGGGGTTTWRGGAKSSQVGWGTRLVTPMEELGTGLATKLVPPVNILDRTNLGWATDVAP